MTTVETPCYLWVPMESVEEIPTSQELKHLLEKGSEEEKIQSMKKLIVMMSHGDPCDDLLMFVIRFVLPTRKNKTIKKLLLLYFELADKLGMDGKLKQEMILVWYVGGLFDRMWLGDFLFFLTYGSNALRNDLQHPNEYVRGTTLRFLTKLKEPELLEPLIPSIRTNVVTLMLRCPL